MGWPIDAIMWFHVRDEILQERYAGCMYRGLDSNSAIIIRHRGKLTEAEMKKIARLFPDHIRVEFQEVFYEGENTRISEYCALVGDKVLCTQCSKPMIFEGVMETPEGEVAVYMCPDCTNVAYLAFRAQLQVGEQQ